MNLWRKHTKKRKAGDGPWAMRHVSGLRATGLLVLIAVAIGLPPMVRQQIDLPALRLFAVVALAFLPGWLFLRFVSVRAQSVLDEYVLNLHRLGMDLPQHLPEPPRNSIYHGQWSRQDGEAHRDEPSIYRDKFDVYYGGSPRTDQRGSAYHLRPEACFPVFLATAVFAAGWTAVLGRIPLDSLDPSHLESVSTTVLLGVGFVGAYLFTLQMLIRRYFQADLKASAYVNAVTRVVSALALVPIVNVAVLQDAKAGTRVGVAFLIGFFPLVGLQAISKLGAIALRTVVPSLRNAYPLSDLDGLSVWYEARLLELGIEDMENLATANLVDVILHSRVPVSRLVDWVDQAHLYLHLEPRTRKGRKDTSTSSREQLRRLGVRTATSLEDAFRPCPEGDNSLARGLISAEANEQFLDDLRAALKVDGVTLSVTTSLLKTFDNDPNLRHVRHWKTDWTLAETEPCPPVPAASAVPPVPALVGANGSNGTNGSSH